MLFGSQEEDDNAGGPELDAISGVETRGVLSEAVDEGAVATTLIFDEEALGVFADDGVLARDLGVGQTEIAVGLAANGEGKGFDRDGMRLISVLNDEACRVRFTLHRCSQTEQTGC
jgi:hypothetical protein